MTRPEVVAVCMRFSTVKLKHIAAGSTFTELCEECGERICTAPSTLEMIREIGRAKVGLVCVDCWEKRPAHPNDLWLATLSQAKEFVAHKPKDDEVQ